MTFILTSYRFDDCFRLGKKIDEGPYLLPDPQILNKAPGDQLDIPSSQHLEGATSARPDTTLVAADCQTRSSEKLTVFKNKKIMLFSDLAITERLRAILRDLIRKGGGEVVNDVDHCDWFVCQYREGSEYIRAAQGGKDVGNLAWIYYLIIHNEWTSPLRRLLHYPIPKGGIPGFKDLRITLSNYGGEARIYLENLVTAAGGLYTKTMKADNTHLITARKNSEKCDAAQDWNINMVNHLWIEESYAKCELLSVSSPKFTHFPPRTNLGEIIGQTFFDETKLREKYYPGGDDNLLDDAALRKRKITEAAQQNAYSHGPAAGVVIGRQEHQDFDVLRDDDVEYSKKTTKQFGVPAPPKPNKPLATPARGRHVLTGKENDTPSVYSSGSRSAKDKALHKLQDLAPDIALYEKERKRMPKDGHGPWGGKRAADQIDKERGADRSSSPAHEQSEDAEEAKRPAKRQKPSLPPVETKICLTSFTRWTGDKNKEDADRVSASGHLVLKSTLTIFKRKLRNLGIQIVQDSMPCDYLAAPQVVRTIKFLRCLARGPEVINSSFVEDCLSTGKVPAIEKYKLKDKANETKFGISLEKSVKKARANQGKLLWNIPVYCTADIKNGPDSFRVIAEANGAIFKVYRARSGTTIRPTNPDEEDGPPEPVYLLTSGSPSERQLWSKFEDMARQGNMEPRVVASDWLLDVAMRQEVIFKKSHLASEYFKKTKA